jgi:hypothetical protein
MKKENTRVNEKSRTETECHIEFHFNRNIDQLSPEIPP